MILALMNPIATILYFLSLFNSEPEVFETEEHIWDAETMEKIDDEQV